MIKRILIHLYIITMVTVAVMAGNILADNYGPSITSTFSSLSHNAEREVEEAQRSVKSWNENLLD